MLRQMWDNYQLKRAIKAGGIDAQRLARARASHFRAYKAGDKDRLTADWNLSPMTADGELKIALETMRNRSRDLEQNNDYAKRFISMNVNNVVGPSGITMQSKVKNGSGNLDVRANEVLEDSFKRWGMMGTCTVDGRLSWHGVQSQIARTRPRDGEVLIRMIRGADNPWSFALQMIEIDHLDTRMDNKTLSNGNFIRMGVELNEWRRPVAYHLMSDHPGEYMFRHGHHVTARVPADEIIHIFIPLRPEQTRGVPDLHTAMYRLKMVGAYEEAEVIAARIGASKMGFYKSIPGEGGEYQGDDLNPDGSLVMDMSPGTFERLPQGIEVDLFDPKHPNAAYEPFIKTVLRGIASGLDVSYISLSNNLEGVSYSSIRQGVLDERSVWRTMQKFYIEIALNRIYGEWLKMALLTDLNGRLAPGRFERYNVPLFKGRGWDWVDPLKDTKANIEQINNFLASRTHVLAEKGLNFTDIVDEQARELEYIKEKGLTVAAVDKAIVSDEADEPDVVDEIDEPDDESKGGKTSGSKKD